MKMRGVMQAFGKLVLGDQEKIGWIRVFIVYLILVNVAYLYLNPMFYMVSTMFKSTADLLDPTVRWIPRVLDWSNLKLAWQGLKFPEAIMNSLLLSVCGALFHVVSCSLSGYAFARFKFPGRNVLFGVLLFSLLIPPQATIVGFYLMYKNIGLLGTPLAILIPALLAQGIRGGLFVIIFRQFFQTVSKEMEEAARIDGAGALRIFYRIMMPLARPAILVVFLFSFVWHWNETYMTSMVVGTEHAPLSLRLSSLNTVLNGLMESEGKASLNVNESIKMAAGFLIIVPPLLIYSIAQRWFIQSVEKTGIVE